MIVLTSILLQLVTQIPVAEVQGASGVLGNSGFKVLMISISSLYLVAVFVVVYWHFFRRNRTRAPRH